MRIRDCVSRTPYCTLFDFGAADSNKKRHGTVKFLGNCSRCTQFPSLLAARISILWGERQTRYGVIAAEPAVEIGNKMVMSLSLAVKAIGCAGDGRVCDTR